MFNTRGILNVTNIMGCPVIVDILDGTTEECKSSRDMSPKHIVIHNTGNGQGSGATDTGNNNFMKNDDDVLWHFTVDDDSITQGWSILKTGLHTGDGRFGEGNSFGIGIEIVDSKNVYKAVYNAYKLIKALLDYIPEMDITKHQDYSGKYCPRWILDNMGWDKFIKEYEKFVTANKEHWAQEYYDYLNANGIIIHETRFDDSITRGEVFALLAKIHKDYTR